MEKESKRLELPGEKRLPSGLRLSKRMQMLADLVSPGGVLADVGCDHGLLPIYLTGMEKIQRAIAMDLRIGPLERARENITFYGCGDRIETRLSDGLEKLEPGEADHILIAGMGGGIILHILRDGAHAAKTAKELILQPQSEIERVRLFLWEQGYRILEEDMTEEDQKFYPALKVVFVGDSENKTGRPTAEELLFGPCLINKRHPVLKSCLKREQEIYSKLKESMDRLDAPGERTLLRARQIERRLDLILQTLQEFG